MKHNFFKLIKMEQMGILQIAIKLQYNVWLNAVRTKELSVHFWLEYKLLEQMFIEC